MPHVVVKLYAGRTEDDKSKLADAITSAVMAALHITRDSISVGVEDVDPLDWKEAVYEPDIQRKANTIYKKPGYVPA